MYEPFAEQFGDHAHNSAFNAHYDRPAMLELIGDVRGLDVLDAGCGPGFYAQALVEGGARVTACDASPTMVDLTRSRVGDRADVRVADIDQALDWLPDDSQDVAVMALVIHHLERRDVALNELHRVLRPGGHLIVSTVHPMDDWRRLGGSYFEVAAVNETWNEGWDVRFWRQPLEVWCQEFSDAGFLIERLIEPRPAESMRAADPQTYEKLCQAPAFIAFRLLAP